jgi:hypothetical protein
MKKIELAFYKTAPAKDDIGLKIVIWAITETETGAVTYDWGFGNWNGESFDGIDVPDGYTAIVARWANTVNPDVILNDSLIIT